MILTNEKIYQYASILNKTFNAGEQQLPIKVGFYLMKNKLLLNELAQEIEKVRVDILSKYGVYVEETSSYQVPPENIEIATKELNDLFILEQDVNIYTVSLDFFNDSDTLTTAQIEALMFMIKEE